MMCQASALYQQGSALRCVAGGGVGEAWYIIIPLHRYRETSIIEAVTDDLKHVVCPHIEILDRSRQPQLYMVPEDDNAACGVYRTDSLKAHR